MGIAKETKSGEISTKEYRKGDGNTALQRIGFQLNAKNETLRRMLNVHRNDILIG